MFVSLLFWGDDYSVTSISTSNPRLDLYIYICLSLGVFLFCFVFDVVEKSRKYSCFKFSPEIYNENILHF